MRPTNVNRDAAIQARLAELSKFGLQKPSGQSMSDLVRDLTAGRRVPIECGFTTQSRAKGDPNDRLIEFVCSTEGQKRDGNVVRANGFRFENFDRNPVATWCHRYDILPVGKWVEREVAKVNGVPSLCMTAQFMPGSIDEFAEKVFQCYLGGYLNAVSIGWEALKYRELKVDGKWTGAVEFLESDLLECAFVLIPADPDALPRATRAGIFDADSAVKFARWAEIDRGCAYVLSSRQAAPGETANAGDDSDVRTVARGEKPAESAAAATRADDQKECPDCGAANAADAEACARCGYTFAAGAKVDQGEKASNDAGRALPRTSVVLRYTGAAQHIDPDALRRMGVEFRKAREAGKDLVLAPGWDLKVVPPLARGLRVVAGAKVRSDMTDALDAAYDELRGLAYRHWEHVESLGYTLDALCSAEQMGEAGDEWAKHWAGEMRGAIGRTQRRLAELTSGIDGALARMGDGLAMVAPEDDDPLDEGASAAADESGVVAIGGTAAATGGKTRVGKKIAKTRLERLIEAENGIIAGRDGIEAARSIMRAVIDEAIDQQKEKEPADDQEAEKEGGEASVDDAEKRDGKADAEVQDDDLKQGAKGKEDSKKVAGVDPLIADIETRFLLPAPALTPDLDDPLVRDLQTQLRSDPQAKVRKLESLVDSFLAGTGATE